MAILSIQSQVSYGYVGNSVAQPALQALGHDVWAVPTVLFSNHPGYGAFQGDVRPSDDIRRVLKGVLALAATDHCDAILSGYLGRSTTGVVVHDTVITLRRRCPELLYVCDPVIGDVSEGVYVDAGLVDIFRDCLLPMADVITPNAFELSLLSDAPVTSISAAVAAARHLISNGPRYVIVTSVVDPDRPGKLTTLLVSADQAVAISHARIDQPPKGAGDLLTAIWLGRHLNGEAAGPALAAAVGSVFDLIGQAAYLADRELPVIRQRHLLLMPDSRLSLTPVSN